MDINSEYLVGKALNRISDRIVRGRCRLEARTLRSNMEEAKFSEHLVELRFRRSSS
jgi:hypothetical protein